MADRLEVDLEGLSDFAANLESIRARLDATRAYVRSFEGDLGSGRVADAMDHFEGRWSDGRAKIDGNATTLSTMVTESVKAYRETDEGLRTALDESMQVRPGVSGPALRGDDPLGFSRTVPDSWFELDLRPQTRDSAIQSLVHDRRADRGHRRPPGSESRVAGRDTSSRASRVRTPDGAGYRLGSDRGSPNDGRTLFSKRVRAQIRSPVRVST